MIEGGVERTLRVVYGSRSGTLTLAATAVDAGTLEWQLLPGLGPGVEGSEVNFPNDEGVVARVVYLVPGGIREKDQFSVQVNGGGGSDEITILIEPYSPP